MGRFAALAKGEVEDEKASNPVRLCACDVDAVEEASVASLPAGVDAPLKGEEDDAKEEKEAVLPPENGLPPSLPAAVQGEGEGCFPPKIRGPVTLENGEVVDA